MRPPILERPPGSRGSRSRKRVVNGDGDTILGIDELRNGPAWTCRREPSHDPVNARGDRAIALRWNSVPHRATYLRFSGSQADDVTGVVDLGRICPGFEAAPRNTGIRINFEPLHRVSGGLDGHRIDAKVGDLETHPDRIAKNVLSAIGRKDDAEISLDCFHGLLKFVRGAAAQRLRQGEGPRDQNS